MKRISLVVAAAFLTAAAQSGCSSEVSARSAKDDAQTVSRAVELSGKFESLSMSGVANVTFTRAEGEPSVVVTAAEDVIDLVTVELRDGTLYVSTKNMKNKDFSGKRIDVAISCERLGDVSLRGTGGLTCNDALTGESVSVTASGTGGVSCLQGIEADVVSLRLSGTGGIDTQRIGCQRCSADLSGTGGFHAGELKAEDVSLHLSGTGAMHIGGIEAKTVSAHNSGTGSINLSGKAESAEYHSSGTGSVNAEELEVARVSAHCSGVGKVNCYATETLQRSTSGLGKVNCKGNPQLM